MPEWYLQWSAEYGAMFGMNRTDDGPTFASWWKVFCAKQCTYQELEQAMLSIAGDKEIPKWRQEHLEAINKQIARIRHEATIGLIRGNADDTPNKSTCERCGDTGMIVVPHPRFVVEGVWLQNGSYKPTAAVVCTCYRGRKIVEAQATKPMDGRCMTVGEYEEHIPRELWAALMSGKSNADREASNAMASSRDADKTLGALTGSRLSKREKKDLDTVADGAAKTVLQQVAAALPSTKPKSQGSRCPF